MARGVGGPSGRGSGPFPGEPGLPRGLAAPPRPPPLAGVPGPAQEAGRASAQRPRVPAASARRSLSHVTRPLLTERGAPGQPTEPAGRGVGPASRCCPALPPAREPSSVREALWRGTRLAELAAPRPCAQWRPRCGDGDMWRREPWEPITPICLPSPPPCCWEAFAPQGLPECGSETPNPSGMEGGPGHNRRSSGGLWTQRWAGLCL